MRTQVIHLVAAFAGVSSMLTATTATSELRPAITLRVVNLVHMPDQTLQRAETEASMILRMSGIDSTWLACDAGPAHQKDADQCSRELGPSEFWLQITKRTPQHVGRGVLGFTQFIGNQEPGPACVFYPAALILEDKSQVNLFQILAAAMVHEIGHLLLGPGSHSAWGIMTPDFGVEELRLMSHRWLKFNAVQTRLLQTEVRRRNSESEYGTR